MKPIYLLLLLVLVIGCAKVQDSEIPLEDFDVENVSDVDQVVDDVSVVDSDSFKPIVIKEDGMEVSIDEIYTDFVGNNLLVFYKFHGKDLVERKQDGLKWEVYIYLTKSNLVEMPSCLSNKINDFEWVNTHCMDKDKFDALGNDIKIIYTNRPLDDLDALSHVKIANLDNTFLFNYTSP